VEKLLALDAYFDARPHAPAWCPAGTGDGLSRAIGAALTRSEPPTLACARLWELTPAEPINDLAGELLANRNLLSALAGPSIALTVNTEGSAQAVRMSGEDLTRILVNLVKNAAEAMPGAGRIAITLHEFHADAEIPLWLMLTVEDSGPGIPRESLEKIFDSGYTTALTRSPPKWRLAGLSSRTGLVHYPLHRRGRRAGAFMPSTAPVAEHASRSNCPPAPSDARAKTGGGPLEKKPRSGAKQKMQFNDLRVRRIQCSKQL